MTDAMDVIRYFSGLVLRLESGCVEGRQFQSIVVGVHLSKEIIRRQGRGIAWLCLCFLQ